MRVEKEGDLAQIDFERDRDECILFERENERNKCRVDSDTGYDNSNRPIHTVEDKHGKYVCFCCFFISKMNYKKLNYHYPFWIYVSNIQPIIKSNFNRLKCFLCNLPFLLIPKTCF